MTLETVEEFQTNPLPHDVMGLLHQGLEMKLGYELNQIFVPYSLATALNLVLKDYGITPAFKGELPEEIREHMWAIIWENLDEIKDLGKGDDFKEEN